MDIAIIGPGNVGGTLGRRWIEEGHRVVFGVRQPESPEAKAKVAEIHADAELADVATAAQGAAIVVLATPWSNTEQVVGAAGDLAGKVVIDCTNPLKADLSGLEVNHDRSGGELVAQWADGAKVVKAFNTTGFNIMADPVIGGRAALMLVAGDDAAAKETVITLASDIGFEAVDAGPLASARMLETFAMLWIHLAYRQGLDRDYAFAILRK